MTVIRSTLNRGGAYISRRGYAAKSADDTLYHLAPKGFWKKFRDATVVNPAISSGLPLPTEHRSLPPGSRTERYATPATKASDPAQNPYWKRDVRRMYPRLSVVGQQDLAQLLLAAPEVQASSKETAITTSDGKPELTSAIAIVAESKKTFTPSSLPPRPPALGKWVPKESPATPHDPMAYWPMGLYA
ncbi:hypothetical protein FS837_002697 [Tulasnella sp. UAMH 9824]|nr:hypothetical protein FS837_002697 [Tulasnella sp. UAMH 9824]